MATTSNVKWDLWVFAGPGALSRGQILADMVVDLPTGSRLLAEAIEAPTLLEQLTDEWPAQRMARGLDVEVPPAERSLWRFIEWAASTTAEADSNPPPSPKRALIVLGDFLWAIGEAPKALVPGVYRPPYPQNFTIKRSGSTTTCSALGAPPYNSNTMYSGPDPANPTTPLSKSVSGWLGVLKKDDEIKFGSDDYTYTYHAGGFTDGNSPCRIEATDSGNINIYVGYGVSYPQEFTIDTIKYTTTDTLGEAATYAKDGTTTPKQRLKQWASSLELNGSIDFGDGTYQCTSVASPRVYTKSSTTYNIYFSDKIEIIPTVASNRSLDDVGPAEVDPMARSIDALAAALDDHQIDLLVSDDRDVLQLAALRRLAPRTTVLMGARRSLAGSGRPLTALLEALRSQADLAPEQLAAKAVEEAGQRVGLVALRSSSAPPLLTALDDFASQIPTGDSPVRRGFEEAWNQSKGGDLAALFTRLKTIDDSRATRIETCAAATIIAPSPTEGGIGLDAPGLQLGPASAWTRLLDAVGGPSDAAVVRRTLDDMQTLTASARRAKRLAPTRPAQAGLVLEYPDGARSGDVEPARDFARFSKEGLEHCDARHVVLVIRGKWDAGRPGSVTFADGASLPVAALAQCLGDTLSRRRHGPLALLVFDDPELLRVENAYELREVAYVLMTAAASAKLPTNQWLSTRMDEVVGRCEQRAADALGQTTTSFIPALVHEWRRDVAVRLAKYLALPEPDEAPAVALQAIDLRHLGGLCRLLDRLCHRMYDALDDELVLAATRAGAGAPNLLEWIYRVQMNGFWPFFQRGKGTKTTRELHDDWGNLYNWISGSEDARAEGGAPLWIAPDFTTDRSASGPGSRLRISVGSHLPKDYRSLSFNQDVTLHALLTAARLLHGPDSQPYWKLISMGLAYGPSRPRHEQLGRLVDEPGAAHYFSPLGDPPSMSLAIDRDPEGYELRLTSSESRATLVGQRCFTNLDHVRESLEGLGHVMSGSMASGQGFEYVQGLGAGLAEDVLGPLRRELERQREILLETGRCREAHLALQLPRELMPLPWELMQLPVQASSRGLEMLAERFAVGRQMWTGGGVRAVKRDPREMRVLVVADPITDQGNELPAARMEGRHVQKLCAKMTEELQGVVAIVSDVSIHETLTRTVLRQRLRSGRYDVLHFAGHGKFANALDQSGWLLSDGWLTGTELSSTLSSCEAPPWLIYANACSAGLIDDAPPSQYHGNVHGMAEACIRAGVGAYVAPLWRVHDDSARLLAIELYRLLLLQGRTIGVALQQARLRVRKVWEARRGDSGLGDVSWAGMVLFGNPGARLRETTG